MQSQNKYICSPKDIQECSLNIICNSLKVETIQIYLAWKKNLQYSHTMDYYTAMKSSNYCYNNRDESQI